MAMQHNNIHKQKANTVSSLLRNPKIAKAIEDAWDAPLGSSRRVKAKTLISIMKRSGGGRGGPGDFTMSYGEPQSLQDLSVPSGPPENYSSTIIVPPLPPMSIGGQPKPTNFIDLMKPTAPEAGLPKSGGLNFNTRGKTSDVVSNLYNRGMQATGLTEQPRSLLTPRTTLTAPTISNVGQDGQPKSIAGVNNVDPNQTYDADGNKVGEPSETPSFVTPEKQNQITEKRTPTSKWGGVQSAVNANMGPSGFAMSVLGDKDKLKELFPNAKDGQLPMGASLSANIDVKDAELRKKYGLDELLNRRDALSARGSGLKETVTSYIAGRDQYLNEVAALEDKAKDAVFSMDMANPEVSKQMENYMKYISIMKGRQNKRYIDYLNTAIDTHNAEIENVTNVYNTNRAAYEERFKTMATITQEEYNQYYTALTDMYTRAENAPTVALNQRIAEQQLLNANLETLRLNNALLTAPDLKILEDANKIKPWIVDKDDNLLPDANLSELVGTAIADGKSPAAVQFAYSTLLGNSLRANKDNPTEFWKTLDQGQRQIQEYANNGGGQGAADMAEAVMRRAMPTISEYILSNATGVRAAVNNLTTFGKGWFSKGTDVTSDAQKQKWIEQNSDIDRGLLEQIYNDYANRLKNDPYFAKNKEDMYGAKTADDSTLANMIGTSLSARYIEPLNNSIQ